MSLFSVFHPESQVVIRCTALRAGHVGGRKFHDAAGAVAPGDQQREIVG